MASVAQTAPSVPLNKHRSRAGSCRACGGTGDTLLGIATCEPCHGSGYHLPKWDRYTCPQCGGELHQPADSDGPGVPMPCRACRGKAVES